MELQADLVTTLVKRWRLETNTFNLPCREVTITFQDVALQLGLSVDDLVVTGRGKLDDPWGTCERILGRVPPNNENRILTTLKFTWLIENFQHLPRNLMQMDIIDSTMNVIANM